MTKIIIFPEKNEVRTGVKVSIKTIQRNKDIIFHSEDLEYLENFLNSPFLWVVSNSLRKKIY